MKLIGVVQGSKEQAKERIINKDTVYIHKNIKEIENEDGTKMYEYEEIQYDKDEYIELLSYSSDLLGQQLAKAKMDNFKKDMVIQQLGKAQVENRLAIMKLEKGGK